MRLHMKWIFCCTLYYLVDEQHVKGEVNYLIQRLKAEVPTHYSLLVGAFIWRYTFKPSVE